ncbi:MAG TPA: oxygenase MpaB family protein [Alcanivorax sp.]|nr:oxygenase MpaB family protein [Alcanivorax sp.]
MNAPAHPPAVPERARPYAKTQAPTPLLLRRFLGRPLAPSEAEYLAVTEGLWHGDPAMDTLVDWIYDHGTREGRALFEQALEQGIDAVPAAPEPLRRFFDSVDRRPDWVDPALIDEGARFIHRTGLTATYVLRDLALMGGYLLSGFNQSLVLTGALSQGTARRVAETGKWWIDCTEPGGLGRFGEGFKTTLRVRLVHSLVRRNLSGREEWDSARWGLPLCQTDMVATYLGFSVVMLGGLRKLGVPVTGREARAVMHLWSYACWVMGVDERWLAFNERDGAVRLHHCLMTQSRPDWTSRELGAALAREPLERHFKRFQGARRWLLYRQHLSVSRYFLDREKMGQLGLPAGVTPWYPLLTLVPRLLGYSAQRWLPGLEAWQRRRGRDAQHRALASMFGDGERAVTEPPLE